MLKLKVNNNLLLLLIFLNIPNMLINPENCTKFPNCSDPKYKPIAIMISPDPAKENENGLK